MGISQTGPYPGLLSVFSQARRREACGMAGVAVEAQAALAVNLCKTYGAGHATVRALDNVKVAFERGRFTAVKGPSGSGKSTLMHCMAGLDRPTSGKAYVGGQDIGQLDDAGLTRLRRDRIGFVFVGAASAVIGAISQTEGDHSSLPVHLLVFLVALTIDMVLFPSFMWLIHDREQQVVQHRKSLDELSEVNRRLEATIAENEGLHRQLLVQARETGVFDERRRMARETHDTLAQGLTGIVTQLQAAEQVASRVPGDPSGWRRHVDAAKRLARDSLSEARRSVDALRPEPLDGCRLSEALTSVAERWSAMNGIPAQVTTTGTAQPINPEAEFALLRAAQEALANVARHAHATRVGLTISYMENEVALDVRDDGVGFDPAMPDRGFGLVAMRQRIAALSGTLQVESEPGGGTAVSACVPTVPALASS
jgi:signal transduction histidine kinase